jgi:hypothetical protein
MARNPFFVVVRAARLLFGTARDAARGGTSRAQAWRGQADRLGLRDAGALFLGHYRGHPVEVELGASTHLTLRTETLPYLRIHHDPSRRPTHQLEHPGPALHSTRCLGALEALPEDTWVEAVDRQLVLYLPERGDPSQTLQGALDVLVDLAERIEHVATCDPLDLVTDEPHPQRLAGLLSVLDPEQPAHREALRSHLSHPVALTQLAAAVRLVHEPTLAELAADPRLSPDDALRAAGLLGLDALSAHVGRLWAEGTPTARLQAVRHAGCATPADAAALLAHLTDTVGPDLWDLTPRSADERALATDLAEVFARAPYGPTTPCMVALLRDAYPSAVQTRVLRRLERAPDTPELLAALRRVRPQTSSWIHGAIGQRLASQTGATDGAVSLVEHAPEQGALSAPEELA